MDFVSDSGLDSKIILGRSEGSSPRFRLMSLLRFCWRTLGYNRFALWNMFPLTRGSVQLLFRMHRIAFTMIILRL